MPTIRIDDGVMDRLWWWAKELDLHFASPNEVISKTLAILDDLYLEKSQTEYPSAPQMVVVPQGAIVAEIPNSYPNLRTGTGRKWSASGRELLAQHIESGLIDLRVVRAYYSKEGNVYSIPKEYPVALFDPRGFVIIESEKDITHSPRLRLNAMLDVSGGISSLDSYSECGHSHINEN